MKYSYTCQQCKEKQVYKPRNNLPKDPHTKCSDCGYENHFTEADLIPIDSEKVAKRLPKSTTNHDPPPHVERGFIDDPDELLISVAIRELNKPNPNPSWANILINCRKENISIKNEMLEQFKQLPTQALVSLLNKSSPEGSQ